MIVLHYLLIDSSSLYLLYFSAKERFYVFNDSKPRRQKTFCQRHFVLCRMASAYPFYHSCTFLQYRMDPSDPLAASLPVSFCHRSSLSGMRRDACLCLPFKRRPDSFVLVSSGRPVLLSSLCHFYGDTDDGTDSPQENKFAVSRSFFPVRICLFGGNPHFGAMDRQNNSGPPMRAAIFVINRLYTMKCRRGKTAASTALLRFHCLDQCY